ncbi:MAG: RNA 2',3'-cyclic phosphodiesterase, partial [Anaerolineales bacterium]
QFPDRMVRWVRPENVHLTLAFLGDLPAERIPEVQRVVEPAAAETPPLHLSVGGLGAFPRPQAPRVIWIGVQESSGRLEILEDRLEDGLRRLGWEPPEEPFRPHLTLGRVRRGAPRPDVERLVASLQSASAGEIGSMIAPEAALFRSDLTPDGAVYTRLATVPFLAAA